MVFAETPSIADNTVFLGLGQLEWLDDEVAGVKLRIVTTPGKKESGQVRDGSDQATAALSLTIILRFLFRCQSWIRSLCRPTPTTPEKIAAQSFMTRTHCYAIRTPATNPSNRESFWRSLTKLRTNGSAIS